MATPSNFPQYIQPISVPGAARSLSPDEAKQWFKYLSNNNRQMFDQFKSNVAAFGLKTDKKTLQKIWNDAVDWTQVVGGTSGNPLDYFNVFDPMDYVEAPKESRYGTTAQRDERVTQYSTSSAADIVMKTSMEERGMGATAKEKKSFLEALNAAAAKEPSIYEGSTTTAPGKTSSKGMQTTGFDPSQFARDWIRSQSNYAESFVAKDFIDVLSRIIQSPAKIGRVVE